MGTYGRTILTQGGRGLSVLRSGIPDYKDGGITIDWTTAPAAASTDTTLSVDGNVIPAYHQYLRYGQVMCRITSGGSSGKFGPYDATATDGRQDLNSGDCFLLPYTVVDSDPKSDNPGVIDSGSVYQERITDLTGNPAIEELRTAFPRVRFGLTD